MTLKYNYAKLGLVNLQGVIVIFSKVGSLHVFLLHPVVNDEQLMISMQAYCMIITSYLYLQLYNVIYDLWLHLKILDIRLFLSSSLLQPTVCLPVSSTCSYSVAQKLWIYQ